MSAADVYLVRHAEAAGTGAGDPGLSDRGREQARALGRRLSGARVAGILHSPRRRAAETAGILAEHLSGVPVRTSTLLDDRTPVPSIARRGDYPERHRSRLEATPAGEQDRDGAHLSQAVSQLADAARDQAASGPLLLVTHAFVIGWFVRSALDAPTWRWIGLNPHHTSLTIIRYAPEGPSLITFNDTGHLAPPAT